MIETIIKGKHKGKYTILCNGITENKYLNYEYYVDNQHVATLCGEFYSMSEEPELNPSKWRYELMPFWRWSIDFYWKDQEKSISSWCYNIRFGERVDEEFEAVYGWRSIGGGKEGIDYFINEFGKKEKLTDLLQPNDGEMD